jgi:hypothetical protein
MRSVAMLAALGICAIWSTSAEAGLICHERCSHYVCRQICRPYHAEFGPFWAYSGYGWPYWYKYIGEPRRGWTVSPY